jgi:hypothetical protein
MNSIHQTILELLKHEPSITDKLDMLTAIGIQTIEPKVFKACEEIRNNLCTGSNEMLEIEKDSGLENGQEWGEIRGLLHEKFRDEITGKLNKIAGHVIE